MKMRTFIMVTAGVGLMTLFQNCSKQGLQIKDLESMASESTLTPSNETPSSTPDNPVPPTSAPDLIASCDEAKSRGKIQTKSTQVVFEDNVGQCQWGLGENLSQRNGYARARAEQVRQVTVPAGAVVCQVHLEDVDQQNFQYDDNIILTLNNYMLAATTNFETYFQKVNGYYRYDWSRLANKDGKVLGSDTVVARQYCAGKDQGLSACLFPLTQTNGSVQLQFHERVIQNILGMTSATDINLAMITTGDDNAESDCHHNPIRFNVKVDYF